MGNLNQKLSKIEQDKRCILSNYQKERHLKLLKRSEELKSLSIDASEEALELSHYSDLLEEQLKWETREYFLQLQEKFLKNKITIGEFCYAFPERDVLNSETAGMLESNFILLSPHKKSLDFSKLTHEILEACYGYDPDPESLEIWERKKKEFRDLIQTIYLQFQEILKENRTTFKDSTDFSELVDQLTWKTKDQYFELIEEFLDDSSKFLNLKKKHESLVEVAKELESNSIFLEPSYQALGFSNFIHILIQLFDRYQMDSEISPKVFKYWVRKILLEMKNHYS